MYTNLLTVASLCAVVLAGPQLNKRQDVDASAIASSLSSLSSALVPNPSLASQLTNIPTSIQALQTSPAGLSQLAEELLTSKPGWYSSLSPDAKSYVLDAGAARASIFSLEALLTSATAGSTASVTAPQPTITAPVTGIINGTTATLIPVGTGGLTIASSTSATGGNSTVTTRKLSSTATETETKTTDKSATNGATGKSTPSPMSSSSKAGAAQVTGAIGAGFVGLVGLVWVL
ncbi:hypothetical protein OCU04_010227 [Sclerotinia nivalis]|uniref:GPI anchored protein n=1 Tax=Sclerotinia nivalis TaxID=352851 RepID=A0A9X0AE42_9HELO|nr:hypothetical protein OCU04_010227 [Sclerotinia nivalis]